MRGKRLSWFGVLLLAVVPGCSSPAEVEGDVEIRVRNGSAVDFAQVAVWFPDVTELYGAVAAGRATEYRAIGRAYRYAGLEVVVGADTARLVPIDYVGEALLGGGRYTYVVGLAGPGSLTLELQRD